VLLKLCKGLLKVSWYNLEMKMNKNRSMEYGVWSMELIFVSFFLLTSYFLLPTSALAQAPTEYELLAPIPQLSIPGTEKSNTAVFLPGLVKLIIGIATALAVIMLMWGGIQYMSTDAWAGKSEAKDTITNALVGLLLVISAWLILYTINPKLVEINLNIPKQEISELPPPGGVPPPGGLTTSQVFAKIAGTGVRIVPGISVNGVQERTIDEVINLKKDCLDCLVAITSATGGDHETTGTCNHGSGHKVDLRVNTPLNEYITKKYSEKAPRSNGDRVFQSPGGATYVWESHPPVPRPAQWGAHWDVAKC